MTLLDEYVSIYGVNTWALSTYESRQSILANYVRPIIGDMKLEDVSPRVMDKYYRDLLKVKAVSSQYAKARTEFVTPHTVKEVHRVLRNAFNQADKMGADCPQSGRTCYSAKSRIQRKRNLDSQKP